MNPQPVLVGWIDSTLLDSGGWVDAADIPGWLDPAAMRHESVGYLVGETDQAIALAGSRNSGDRLAGVMTIPKVAIVDGPTRLVVEGLKPPLQEPLGEQRAHRQPDAEGSS